MAITPIMRAAVINIRTRKIGIITKINEQYGWFLVTYENGKIREYSSNAGGTRTVRLLTKEEYADHLLRKENSGLSDYWRD